MLNKHKTQVKAVNLSHKCMEYAVCAASSIKHAHMLTPRTIPHNNDKAFSAARRGTRAEQQEKNANILNNPLRTKLLCIKHQCRLSA